MFRQGVKGAPRRGLGAPHVVLVSSGVLAGLGCGGKCPAPYVERDGVCVHVRDAGATMDTPAAALGSASAGSIAANGGSGAGSEERRAGMSQAVTGGSPAMPAAGANMQPAVSIAGTGASMAGSASGTLSTSGTGVAGSSGASGATGLMDASVGAVTCPPGTKVCLGSALPRRIVVQRWIVPLARPVNLACASAPPASISARAHA